MVRRCRLELPGWHTGCVDRRRLFPFAVGGVLGLSAMSSVAAGFDAPPTDYQVLCLLSATISATLAGVLTAPVAQSGYKKIVGRSNNLAPQPGDLLPGAAVHGN